MPSISNISINQSNNMPVITALHLSEMRTRLHVSMVYSSSCIIHPDRIFIAVLFLRYVVFEDPKKALREAGQRKKKVAFEQEVPSLLVTKICFIIHHSGFVISRDSAEVRLQSGAASLPNSQLQPLYLLRISSYCQS
jgi:hypothetical protein